MARTEKIVLCKMFTGDYWEDEDNIGYESVNLFLPDDAEEIKEEGDDRPSKVSYIYLPASGDYKLEDNEITRVLLVRSVPSKGGCIVQVIGKAEVVKKGELLRNYEENPPKLRISSCTSGTEFVGLCTIFDVFEGKRIDEIVVKEKICAIAEACGYSLEGNEINEKDYYEIAYKLGFADAVKTTLSDGELIKKMGWSDEQGYYTRKKWGRGFRYSLEEDFRKKIKEELNLEIDEGLTDQEYNYRYALLKNKCKKRNVVKDEKGFVDLIKKKYEKALELRKVFESQNEIRLKEYWKLPYNQIFNKNKHYGKLNICASLKVKNLQLVKKDKKLYLTTLAVGDKLLFQENSNVKNIHIKSTDITSDDNESLSGVLSATSQKVYLAADVKIQGNDEKTLWSSLDDYSKDWLEEAKTLTIEDEYTKYLYDSYLTVAKHEYDELTYSNLFAYFFKKSPEFVKHFFSNVKDKAKNPLVEIQTDKDISAGAVEINDEDWKELKGIDGKTSVKREEKNIDIVLKAGDKVIVIENKIKSALNGKEIDGEIGDDQKQGENAASQEKNENNKLTFKDQLIRYYRYIEDKYPTINEDNHKYFIFAPDYNPIENEHFGEIQDRAGETVKMEEKWEVVPYSSIFEGIKDYRIDEDENLKNDFDKNLFKEFLKALYVHTDSSANNYYRQMQKRLMRIKSENDKKNNKS